MPRFMAPPPSGEFQVVLLRPFSGKPTHTVTITGEPNRPATIVTKHEVGGGSVEEKTGQMSADDVQELLRLTSQLAGFPSSETSDIYGADARLELHTLEAQWANAEMDPSGDVVDSAVGSENKGTFKDVVDSVAAAGRQFARADKAQ